MSYKLSGINPLSYMGVEPTTPPLMIVQKRSPSANDINFNLGSFWLNQDTYILYHLVSVSEGTAIWQQVSTGVGGLTGDTGGLVPDDDTGNINITGADSGLLFEGDPNTNTMSLAWPSQPETESILVGVTGEAPQFLPITSAGGTVVVTQTSSAINFEATTGGNVGVVSLTGDSGGTIAPDMAGDIKVLGGDSGISVVGDSVTSTLTLTYDTPGTDGQLLIGSTSAAPVWADITSSDGSIVVTPGAGSLDLAVANLAADCSFLMYQGTSTSIINSSPANTYNLGENVVLSVVFDNGSNVYVGGGTPGAPAYFEVPETGLYALFMVIALNNSGVLPNTDFMLSCESYFVNITTTHLYYGAAATTTRISTLRGNAQNNVLTASTLVSLTAGDQIGWRARVNAGSPASYNWTVLGNTPNYTTYVSGYRIA